MPRLKFQGLQANVITRLKNLPKTNTLAYFATQPVPEKVFFMISGLHYEHTMIINYASSIANNIEALFTGDARVIIYNRQVFIVQATGPNVINFLHL